LTSAAREPLPDRILPVLRVQRRPVSMVLRALRVPESTA
jgi:hypothetical protein